MPVSLTVIVVNWNTRALLARCLESLPPTVQDPISSPAGLPQTSDMARKTVEVIVVDNASSDGSAHMVRERFPWVHLIENEENVGFAVANNQAIRQSGAFPERGAGSKYILLLNADTEVRPGALETMLAFMEAHPCAGAAGARLLNTDGSLQPSCHPMLTPGREFWRLLFLDRLWPRATYPMYRWNAETPRRVEVIKGACLLLRRQALDDVGLLDIRYFMYTEEVDLCYRLTQAGWALWWVPRAEVVHHDGQSSRQMASRMYVQLYRSKMQFYHKYGGRRRATQFKLFLKLAYWPRFIVAHMGAFFSPSLFGHASTYRQLLAELSRMRDGRAEEQAGEPRTSKRSSYG